MTHPKFLFELTKNKDKYQHASRRAIPRSDLWTDENFHNTHTIVQPSERLVFLGFIEAAHTPETPRLSRYYDTEGFKGDAQLSAPM